MPLITPRFHNRKLSKYPHMNPQESRIMTRFLDQLGISYVGFDYDVHVGRGTDPGDRVAWPFRFDFIQLTRLRIDAVGHTPTGKHIIEVKVHASRSTIGQVLTYKALYEGQFPSNYNTTPVIVCQSIRQQTRNVCELLGIMVFTV